jgi:hypothetical protein
MKSAGACWLAATAANAPEKLEEVVQRVVGLPERAFGSRSITQEL